MFNSDILSSNTLLGYKEGFMITGKDISLAAKKDLESFFEDEANFTLNLELDSNSVQHASVVGIGDKLRVRLSRDFCSAQVSGIDDLHYFLFVVSHEIAHYLHSHNEHKDESDYDSKSVEAFADFFGARVMMTLLTYGQCFIKLYEELEFRFHSGEVLNSIGCAISRLAETLFNTSSDLYSNRITRVGHCSAGITSFLDKQFSSINVQRSVDVLTRIYTAGNLPTIFKLEAEQFNMDPNLILRSDEIHKNIQGIDLGITKGVKPIFAIFIGTSYSSTEASRNMQMSIRRSLAQKQGFDIPELT